MRNTLFAVTLFIAAPALASAQGYTIPQSPAFTFLGVAPTKIERPTTARDFAVGLANGIGGRGEVRQGFAVEVAPWTWIPGLSIPVSRYNSVAYYALANLSLSLGSARASGDTSSTDAALGLRTTLVDKSDPMTNAAFVDGLRKAITACNDAPPDATIGDIKQCAAKANKSLRDAWMKEHWNAPSFSVALAAGDRFLQSKLSDRAATGVSGWAALALPLTTKGQLLAQGRLTHTPKSDTSSAYTATRIGARAVFGTSNVNAFMELENNSRISSGGAGRTIWSGGLEFKAADDMWISTGFGKDYATKDKDKIVLIANIQWRLASTPMLK